jgi:uncharacterized protein (TIGR00288 family)
MNDERRLLGVFLDFENLAIGFRGHHKRFDVERVLARLVEKGNIVVKRAYADWSRFAAEARSLQEAAFELIQIPKREMTGKNSADMRLCVDVMDLCYSKAHIDTVVIVSGDSDFSPLVSKLKENGRTVIGLGVKESTSALLRDNCDEFIYYGDLEAEAKEAPVDLPATDKREQEAFALLLDSLKALRRENRDVLWPSLIKETMKRKKPSFNEEYYGFKSFSALLEAAAQRGLLTLSRQASDRTPIVTAFGDEMHAAAPTGAQAKEEKAPRSRRPRRRRRSEYETPATEG